MKTQRLGDSNLQVSIFCLGTLEFGTRVPRDDSFAILDAYHEAGGRFIDTANNYAFWHEGARGGESETLLGDWIAMRRNRSQLVVATKIGAQPTVPGAGFEAAEGLSAPVVAKAVEDCLKRLKLERIDLCYAHIDDRTVPLEETLGAFEDLRSAGKIRELGCSNHTAWRIEQARNISRAHGWRPYASRTAIPIFNQNVGQSFHRNSSRAKRCMTIAVPKVI